MSVQTAIVRRLRALAFRKQEVTHHYWEYYGRLHFVSEAIKKLELPAYKVLDVGGATGNNLLRAFGIRDVTTLDLDPRADIVSSAENIPSPDNSYDMVTCIDTLEHIPEGVRDRCIQEMLRVASLAVFIVAPQKTEANVSAEQLVLKYRKVKFLEEHRLYGLVDFANIERQLQDHENNHGISRFEVKELDNLLSWVILMTLDYVSPSAIYQEAFFLENAFFSRRKALSIFLR